AGNVLFNAPDSRLRHVTTSASPLRPGTYRVVRARSVFYLPNTKGFPKNTEIDMMLTFASEGAGGRGGGNAAGPQQGPGPIPADGGGGGGRAGGGGRGGGLFSGTVASVTPTADSVT